MDEQLSEFISKYLLLSDVRNREFFNPVLITFADPEDTDRELTLIISYHEPSFEYVPFNVLWLPSNESSSHYGNLYRRVSIEPSADFRSTWDKINNFSEIWTEDPYYYAAPQDLREHGITNLAGFVGVATTERYGLVRLSHDSENVAVGHLDPRNEDARYPNEHGHIDYPRTLVKVNSVQHGSFDQSIQPRDGMMPMLTQLNPESPLQWGIVWRYPVFSDLVQIDRSLTHIEIIGPTSILEKTSTDYVVRAFFADGTHKDVVPSRFYGNNNEISSVVEQTLNVFNTTQPETIELRAEYTHKGVFAETDLTVNIEMGIQPASLRIQGPSNVNEESSAVYAFIVTMTDGTEKAVRPDSVLVDDLSVGNITDQGVLFTEAILLDQPLKISARYTEDGITVNAELDINVIDLTPYPVSMAILGPQSLSEGESGTYSIRVTYSDGQIVDAEPVSITSSDVENSTFIDGVLTVGSISEDQHTDITATYRDTGRDVSTSLRVNFINLPPVVVQANIIDPFEVEGWYNGTVQLPDFTIREEFADGTTREFVENNTDKYAIHYVAPGYPLVDGKVADLNFDMAYLQGNDVDTEIGLILLSPHQPDLSFTQVPFVVKAARPNHIEVEENLSVPLVAHGTKTSRFSIAIKGNSLRFNWNGDPEEFIPGTFDLENGDYSSLPQRSFYIQLPEDDKGVIAQPLTRSGIDGQTYKFISLVFPNDMGTEAFDYTVNYVFVRRITLTDGSIEYARAVLSVDYPYTP